MSEWPDDVVTFSLGVPDIGEALNDAQDLLEMYWATIADMRDGRGWEQPSRAYEQGVKECAEKIKRLRILRGETT